MNFRQKIRLSILLAILAVLTVVIVFAISVRGSIIKKSSLAFEYGEALAETQTLALTHEQMVAALRAYLLTGQKEFNDQFVRGEDAIAAAIQRLQRTSQHADDRDLLASIQNAERAYEKAAEKGIEIRERESPAAASQHFEQKVLPLRAGLQQLIQQLSAAEKKNYEDAITDAQRTFSRTLIGLLLFSGLLVLGLALLLERIAHRLLLAYEAIKARDDLTAIVSHELKNPLTSILMSVDLVKKTAPGTPECLLLLKTIDRIHSSARRMSRLVADLLDITSIEFGRLLVSKEITPMDEILSDAVEWNVFQIEAKKIQIEKTLEPADLHILCDRSRTTQALSNIIDNAVKFSDPHGRVILQAIARDKNVLVTVKDFGVGIAPEQLRQIFTKYWQAKQTAYAGVGLGLFISKGLIEAQGGKISAKSELGKGTEVSLLLPRGWAKS